VITHFLAPCQSQGSTSCAPRLFTARALPRTTLSPGRCDELKCSCPGRFWAPPGHGNSSELHGPDHRIAPFVDTVKLLIGRDVSGMSERARLTDKLSAALTPSMASKLCSWDVLGVESADSRWYILIILGNEWVVYRAWVVVQQIRLHGAHPPLF
jgi:hypothetical protein